MASLPTLVPDLIRNLAPKKALTVNEVPAFAGTTVGGKGAVFPGSPAADRPNTLVPDSIRDLAPTKVLTVNEVPAFAGTTVGEGALFFRLSRR